MHTGFGFLIIFKSVGGSRDINVWSHCSSLPTTSVLKFGWEPAGGGVTWGLHLFVSSVEEE